MSASWTAYKSLLCQALATVLVRPVIFLRIRVPDGLNPRLTAPMYRFLDASQ
jgi:hypothetical protein